MLEFETRAEKGRAQLLEVLIAVAWVAVSSMLLRIVDGSASVGSVISLGVWGALAYYTYQGNAFARGVFCFACAVFATSFAYWLGYALTHWPGIVPVLLLLALTASMTYSGFAVAFSPSINAFFASRRKPDEGPSPPQKSG